MSLDHGDNRSKNQVYPLDELDVELLGGEEHVGAGVAVEHELALAVGAQRDEGEGGARPGVEDDTAVLDTVVAEDGLEHAAELVVPELADEGGLAAEARDSDGDVGRRAPRRLDEGGRLRQRHPRHRRHEVYQHLPETNHQLAPVRHCTPLLEQQRAHGRSGGERERERERDGLVWGIFW
jgi:hypothetical protein